MKNAVGFTAEKIKCFKSFIGIVIGSWRMVLYVF
jgi:hypothetical protein